MHKNRQLSLGVLSLLTFFVYAVLHLILSQKGLISDIHIDYIPVLENLLNGRGLVYADGTMANRYPPLFPLLLYVLHGSSGILHLNPIWFTSIFSILQIIAIGLILAKLGEKTTGTSTVGKCAFIFYTGCPFVVFSSFKPLSSIPYTLFTVAAIYVWIALIQSQKPAIKAIQVGVLLGLANLIRPIGLFVPLILGLGAWVWWALSISKISMRSMVLSVSILIGSAYLTIIPWSIYQYANTGEWVLLSKGGFPSMKDGLSFNYKKHRHPLRMSTGLSHLISEFTKRYSSYQTVGDIGRFFAEQIKTRPGAVLKLVGLKLARSWYGTDSQNPVYERINRIVSLIYILLFLIGIYWLKNDMTPIRMLMIGMTIALVGYYWSLAFMVLSIVRYMVPVFGLLGLIFSAGLVHRFRLHF